MTRKLMPAVAGLAVVIAALFGTGRVPAPPAPGVPGPRGEPAAREAEAELPPDVPTVMFPAEPLASFGTARLRHEGKTDSLAFSPDGKVLATAVEWDPFVHLWDVSTGREVRRIRVSPPVEGERSPLEAGMNDPQPHVAGFTPDGRRLVLRRGDDVLVCDPATGATKAEITGGARCGVAISPDGSLLAGHPPSGQLTLWATETGRVVRELGEVPATVGLGVCFSPDGTRVAAFVRRDLTGVLVVAPVDGSTGLETRFTVGPPPKGPLSASLVWRLCVHWPRADRVLVYWNKGHIAVDPDSGREVARGPNAKNNWLYGITTADGRVFSRTTPGGELVEIDLDTFALTPRGGDRLGPVR